MSNQAEQDERQLYIAEQLSKAREFFTRKNAKELN